ncbi:MULTISPECIES: FxsB family cyclophane-forming radical SAM/SPASM peptide maturase [unclassified Actinomadura]|uniref:FxsB family cyclophane-forming radical SAM/SPASM peptide maturase n=1 Tax=unclassified Actinomadura TaxID=2626254 RepID=UPI0011ED172D|nr:FxsB family cyclophane-forming radical SAM/SPASM peptide maturase [Actinomadura sp. K4S16]
MKTSSEALPHPPFGDAWPAALDVRALLDGGWRPTPFRQFVLKVFSRCDLACDHCYVYEMRDQSWRGRPRAMPREVLDRAAERIADHVATHDLDSVTLVLHGGEPLLAGTGLLGDAVRTTRDAVRRAAGPGPDGRHRVRAVVQTNGVRLGTRELGLFDELNVRVGVSLDGAQAAHDRRRRHADGRGSHAEVQAALDRLSSDRYRHLFAGLLCTVDLRNDPVETYEALLRHGPPTVDLLLPHANWSEPPPGQGDPCTTPYGDWLAAVFDRWYAAPRRETGVRLLEEILQMLLGGASSSEAIGLSPVGVVVIETDGAIEQSDSLKSAFPGAPRTGRHVFVDSFDEVLLSPFVAARQIGLRALCPTCSSCPVNKVCGGGHYAHRYSDGNGFLNPSVYCSDLLRLIMHIRARVAADLPRTAARRKVCDGDPLPPTAS